MIEAKHVAEESGHTALEDVQLGQSVVADAEQDVNAERRPGQDLGERVPQGAAAITAVVEEVLLHLIEDEVDLAAHLGRAFRQDVGQHERRLRILGPGCARDRGERVVPPLIDDDRQRPVALAGGRACEHGRAQAPHDPCPQQ